MQFRHKVPLTTAQRGHWAERRAEWYYRCRGWHLVARNWLGGGGGELDLVLSRWRTLLVVEVRFRKGGHALQSVDAEKLARTLKAARALIRGHHLQRYTLRVDLAAVDERRRVSLRANVESLV